MEDQLILIALLLSLYKKKRKRKYWVHPVNLNRNSRSQYHLTARILRRYPDRFFDYYRMSVASFDELLHLIRDKMTKSDTQMRKAISAEERLTVTLRYLATGDNFENLKYQFLMGSTTISKIVSDTCAIIWDVLQPLEMKPPSSQERWLEISDNFYKKANFPNCVGAADGKHIRLISPHFSGSKYFNYKKYNSIVLMAVVDSDYRFIAVDIGSYGREGDSSVFKQWNFGTKLSEYRLNLPAPKALPNSETVTPYVFLGDEAFPLSSDFLRPYPRNNLNNTRRVFNYRLSRARRIVECAFGILSNKWRVFHTNMTIPPDFAVIVTKAACVLHNFVRSRDGYKFEDTLTHCFDDLPYDTPRYRASNVGRNVRDKFAQYFMTESGEIPWQYNNRYIVGEN